MMDNTQDMDIDWTKVHLMDDSTLTSFANELHESLHVEHAKQAYQILLQRYPNNIEFLDEYTDCLDELGEDKEMQVILKKYFEHQDLILQYSLNHKLLFKYAQTQHGYAAVQYYEYGIQLLIPKLQSHKFQKELADAYAALAEIYQTDLLAFKESEQLCYNSIQNAFKYDPLNLDAFLQLANFHMNKEDQAAAEEDLKVIHQELMIHHDNYDEEFLLSVSKLQVEVEQYNNAIDVLRKLVDRDQSNLESLYMLAFALWKAKHFNEAMKITQGMLDNPDLQLDQEILEGTNELYAQLQKEDPSIEQVEDEWMDIE